MKSDYEILIRQNEYETNEKVSRAARIILYFELIIVMLCWLKVFSISETIVSGAITAAIIPLLLPVIVVDVLHMDKAWVKYLLIASLAAVTGVYYIFLTFQVVLLFVIPMIVAALYLEKKVLYFSYAATAAAILLSHLITAFWLLQPWIEPFSGVKAIMLYGALPRLLEYLCCAVIIQILVSHCRKYISSIYSETVLKAESENKDREEEKVKQAIKAETHKKAKTDIKAVTDIKAEAEEKAERGKNAGLVADEVSINAVKVSDQDKNLLLHAMTEREAEVCRLLSQGYTNAQIAKQLYLSLGTVKNYVSAIYEKTGIKERTVLALMLNRYFNTYDSGHM